MKYIILLILCISGTFPLQAQYNEGLDPSFGDKGIVTKGSSILYDDWEIRDAALQTDGKIITSCSKGIMRFLSNGSFDYLFGSGGISKPPLYYSDGSPVSLYYGFVTVQADDKILVTGIVAPHNVLILYRLLPNGKMDISFGKNGIFCDSSAGNCTGTDIIVQPDGKIIVGAYESGSFQSILRFHSDGRPDSSFGINGKIINKAAELWSINKIKQMPDGRIVALFKNFQVARYLSDGTLDTSFNHTGMAQAVPAPYSQSLAIQADGKVLVCGYTAFLNPGPFIVGRLNVDGSPDTSFAHVGYTHFSWDTGEYNKCFDVMVMSDGKILLGGRAGNPLTGFDNFGIVRSNSDGSLDTSFGKNGRLLTTPISSGITGASMNKFLLQPDNKFLALGYFANTIDPSDFATIARYETNGKTSIVETKSLRAGFSVFPNPSGGDFTITPHAVIPTKEGSINAKVYDLLGRIIYQSKLNFSNQQASLHINAPNGIYILEINNAEGNISRERIEIRN